MAMTRYFFHVHDGKDLIDQEGTELPDFKAARRQAVIHAGELMRDNPDSFWDGAEWSMIVTDERDLTLFSLTFLVSMAPAMAGTSWT